MLDARSNPHHLLPRGADPMRATAIRSAGTVVLAITGNPSTVDVMTTPCSSAAMVTFGELPAPVRVTSMSNSGIERRCSVAVDAT